MKRYSFCNFEKIYKKSRFCASYFVKITPISILEKFLKCQNLLLLLNIEMIIILMIL